MSLEEYRKLNESLQAIKKLQEALSQLKKIGNERQLTHWVQAHRDEFRKLSGEQLESLREKTEYDEEAWQEILRQLNKNDS